MKEEIYNDISEEVVGKWQEMVNIIAEIIEVPSVLITRVDDEYLEVISASQKGGNPYKVGQKDKIAGFYCEEVIKSKKLLLVPDATKDLKWKDNPDIKLGLISYLGLAINNPDGSTFGTICFLDIKENHYSIAYKNLIEYIKRTLELDLIHINNIKEAQKHYNDKSTLFSIIAHDLKNPFTAIIGFSSLLKDNASHFDHDKIKEIANDIYEAANSTSKLLDELQMWVRIKDGQLTFISEQLQFSDLCNSAICTINAKAALKNIEINVDNSGDYMLYGNFNSLRTVLINLLSNALKFTNRGGKIRVGIEQDTKNTTITVCDNGIGMSANQIKALFDATTNSFCTGTEGETGTGLGLTFCKQFIDMHNGKIWVESELGKGSTFYIELPNMTRHN